MDEFELVQKVLDRDLEALDTWIDSHSKQIERFVFQYGHSLESAFEIATDAFATFRSKLENIDDEKSLLFMLYKIVIEKSAKIEHINEIQTDVFLFDEDAELHSKIINIDIKYRIPFILAQFQNFNDVQIALILEIPVTDVKSRIEHAKKTLRVYQIDKRLELLGKSYARLPVLFSPEQLVGVTVPVIKVEKIKSPKKWFVIASALLVGIFISTLLFTNTGETIKSDFEIRYDTERESRQLELKLTDDRFAKLNFIQETDKKMTSFLEKASIHTNPELESEFSEIIKELQLPSEMLFVEMPLSTLMSDEKQSIAFLSLFRIRVQDLISVYNEILWDYRIEIENFEVESYLNKVDQMIVKSDVFSDELENVLNTMQNQSITLQVHPSTGNIAASYINSGLHFSLHENAYGYATMLATEPHVDGGIMRHPLEESFYYLVIMEDTLKKVVKDEVMYPIMYMEYLSLFNNIVKGSKSQNLYDEEEILKRNYQDTWKMLSDLPGASVTTYLMEPIVDEMEASGWKTSKNLDEFSTEKIEEALELARNGELERMMYGDWPIIENDSIELPDPKFISQVEQLYNEFKQSYDITVFKNLSPIYVVGVYDYANEMEDPTTMFNLFNKNLPVFINHEMVVSLEEFITKWRKGFSLFKDMNQIKFFSSNMDRIRFDFRAYVDISSTNFTRNVSVYMDENQNWFMHEAPHEPLPSAQNEPSTAVNGHFMSEIRNLHGTFQHMKESFQLDYVTASSIAGLYMYAKTRGDFETQYELYFQDATNPIIDKEQFLEEAISDPPVEMEDKFKTISFSGSDQDENGNWPGVATITVDIEDYPGEEPELTIPMMWTENGWRIVYTPK